MNYGNRTEAFRGLIMAGNLAAAATMAAAPCNIWEGEGFVLATLGEGSTEELLEAAINGFLAIHASVKHGSWVHSVSHFSQVLWGKRRIDLICRLNQIAFQGAIEQRDSTCCERLVEDMGKYGLWSDDPAEVGLTAENLSWVGQSDCPPSAFSQARAAAGRFSSEVAYVEWELRQPQPRSAWSNALHRGIIDGEETVELLASFRALGGCSSEIQCLVKTRLEEQAALLATEAASCTDGWNRRDLETALEATRVALATL